MKNIRYILKELGRFAPILGGMSLLFFMNCALADEAHDFFLAVAEDNASWVSKMIERGTDPNLRERERGDTGLILALRENAMRSFNVLLNAPKVDLDASANNGDTALMIASFAGNEKAVEALLAKDAEVNRHGWTALHYAAAIGNARIVRMLLEKYAYIDAESPNKTTPLMMAARGGQLEVVNILLDEGADATLRNELGLSALDLAKNNDRRSVVDQLTAFLKKNGKL